MEVKPGDRIPLDKLNAEIREVISLDGARLKALWIDCPMCDLTHWHMIPYHLGDPMEKEGLGKVWRQVSEGGLETLTLAPSYNAKCLHAFVRKGALEVL
jgi:hypothetical protein